MSTILKPKSMSVSDDGGVLAVGIESSAPMTIASSTLSKRTGSAVPTTAAKRSVKSVVVKEGGIDCCRVCGVAFEDMPDKFKFCYRHKRLVQSIVKRWSPKRVKGFKKITTQTCLRVNV